MSAEGGALRLDVWASALVGYARAMRQALAEVPGYDATRASLDALIATAEREGLAEGAALAEVRAGPMGPPPPCHFCRAADPALCIGGRWVCEGCAAARGVC